MTGQPERDLLHRDIHPAQVTVGETVFRQARVFVTTSRLIGYRWVDGNYDRFLDLPLAEPGSVPQDPNVLSNRPVEAVVEDGRTVFVGRDRGCGCGSPLKTLARPAAWR